MKDEWIEKLRSRLENHEETPPQGLFADIQKKDVAATESTVRPGEKEKTFRIMVLDHPGCGCCRGNRLVCHR